MFQQLEPAVLACLRDQALAAMTKYVATLEAEAVIRNLAVACTTTGRSVVQMANVKVDVTLPWLVDLFVSEEGLARRIERSFPNFSQTLGRCSDVAVGGDGSIVISP